MSYDNHGAVLESLLDQLLHCLLSLQVNSGSGFVQDNYLGLPEDGSADADESLLTGTEVATARLNLEVEQ